MPPKRRAATKTPKQKVDKPEHEVKKQKLSSALDACVEDSQLPDEIEADSECSNKSLTVYIDRQSGDAYDVMLNQSNIGKNNNKYFVLQVLHNKHQQDDVYTTWFRWGRVGYKGQVSTQTYDLQGALDAFKKKFKEKTGNQFEKRREFVPKNGKYDLIEIDYSNGDEKPKSAEESKPRPKDDPSIPSKLDPRVKSVVDRICDLNGMARYLSKTMNYDAKKAPLGRITKAQIKAGFQVLSQIETRLSREEFDEEYERLVNTYYTKIPHDFGMSRPNLLRTLDEFKNELDLLEALSNIEVTTSAMKEEQEDIVPMNPSDRNYEKIKCEIRPLETKNRTYKLIETYLKNTKGPTHWYNAKLHNIFEVNRVGESERYTKDIHNRMLLWHGSGLANFFGILSQGLRIAPPEAPVSGYMFGKGVYFANCFSKSAGYCRASSGDRCFMLLAEVALGDSVQLYNADHNASKLTKFSTHGVGQHCPDEKQHKTIKLESEVVVPCGKLVEREEFKGCLYYDEFIVYNTSQIRLRYLLEIELV